MEFLLRRLRYILIKEDSRVAECDIVKVTEGAVRLFYLDVREILKYMDGRKQDGNRKNDLLWMEYH